MLGPPVGRLNLKGEIGLNKVPFEYAFRLFEVPALIHQRDESKLRRIDVEGHPNPYPHAMRQAPNNSWKREACQPRFHPPALLIDDLSRLAGRVELDIGVLERMSHSVLDGDLIAAVVGNGVVEQLRRFGV